MRKWLIRVNNHKIWGPISKERVIELYKIKSLAESDEICSGNGYWFYIREKKLLQRYLLGDELQSFNSSYGAREASKLQEGVKFPRSGDLGYPERGMAESSEDDEYEYEDITLVSEINLNPQKEDRPSPSPQRQNSRPIDEDMSKIQYPSKEDLSYPEKKAIHSRPKTDMAALSPMAKKKSLFQRDDRYLIALIFILLSLLGIVLKNYTGIFNLFGVILLGPKSYALQAGSLPSNKNIIHRSDQGVLWSQAGLSGVVFSIEPNKKIDPCLFFERNSFPLVWYLTEKTHSIEQCISATTEAITMTHLSRISSEKNSLSQIKKASGIWGHKQRNKIAKIHQIKKKLQERPIIEDILEQTNLFLRDSKTLKAPDTLQALQVAGEHLLSQMAQMAIFYQLNNRGRSHTLLRSIFSRDKDFFLIEAERGGQIKDQKKLQREIVSLMKFLQTQLDQNEFKFLCLYLKYYWPEFINEHFAVSLSLKEIRKLAKTFRWGLSYPSLWLEELRARSTQNDIQQYLEIIFKKADSKKLWRNHFWIFSFYTPTRQDIRRFIKEEMLRLRHASSPYDQFLFIKVLSNNNIYDIVKNHLKFNTALFNLKRKTLRKLLEEDQIINFSIQHLLLIGDRGQDLLWWKIL